MRAAKIEEIEENGNACAKYEKVSDVFGSRDSDNLNLVEDAKPIPPKTLCVCGSVWFYLFLRDQFHLEYECE